MAQTRNLFAQIAPSNKYSALFGLLLFLLGSSALFAQDDLNVHGVVSDAMSSSKLDGVKVTVKKDGTNNDAFTTRANGKYEFYLDCNARYEFVFEKEGYVKRSIVIDSKNIPPEVIGAGIIMPTDMSMYAITPAMENADLSVFNAPIGIAAYSANDQDLIWDFNYTNKIKAEIFAFIRDIEKKQKELDKEASAADKADAANEEKFKQLVKDGDAAMGKDKFDDAVLNYKAALDLKPGDMATEGKLGDAQTKLNSKKAAAELAEKYNETLDAGDGFMRTEEYDNAIKEYNAALALKPGETYPTDQIAEANRIKKEREASLAKQQQFDKLMAEGDAAFANEKYSDALTPFEAALKVIPDNKELQGKITKTKDYIANAKAMAAQKSAYNAALSKADAAFGKKEFESAIASYREAAKVKPDESYPQEQIASAETQLAALASAAEAQKSFEDAMKEGNDALASSNYSGAVNSFEKALTIIPNETSAVAKLAEAQGLLAEKEEAKNRKANYDKLVADADKFFADEDLTEAKQKYTEAQQLIADETYPVDQISKINKLLKERAESEATLAAYTAAMNAANDAMDSEEYAAAINQYQMALAAKPDDKEANSGLDKANAAKAEDDALMAEDAQYQKLIASADEKFAGKDFEAAKSVYLEALAVKSKEAYPDSQVKLIDQTLASMADEAAEAERLAKLKAEFDAFMTEGIKAFDGKKYSDAIEAYESALAVMPDDAQALAKLEESKKAREEESKLLAVDEQYDQAIARADEKFGSKQYELAVAAYQEASALKTEEMYPKDQIKLIEETQTANAAALAQAEIEKKTEQANALILEGDKLVKANSFQDGIIKYEEALTLMPDRLDIKQKITDANTAYLAFQEAQGVDAAYAESVASADEAFGIENYDRARKSYEEASSIKPNESYPKDQLKLIAETISANEAAQAKRQAEQVNALVLEGDNLIKSQSFQDGIGKYEDALEIMPERTDLQQKIENANAAYLAYQEAKGVQEAYDDAIADGDAQFEKEKYDQAKIAYLSALQAKPGEAYPKQKIETIDAKLQALADADEAEKQRKLQEDFDAYIASGDKQFSKEKYEKALTEFEDALSLKPTSELALNKISEVNQRLGALDEAQALLKKYENLIADGENLLGEMSLEMAKLKFLDAQELMPDEKYPPKKITEIDLLIEQGKLRQDALAQDEKDAKYKDVVREGNTKMGLQDYASAKNLYVEALNIKPDEKYPKGQLERIELLIKEQKQDAAHAEELATRKENRETKQTVNRGPIRTVNSNSEDQAEQFMQEAREAQEQERYERIRKEKESYTDSRASYAEKSAEMRKDNSDALEYFRQSFDTQFSEAVATKEQKTKNSVNYKAALLANGSKRSDISAINRKDAQKQIDEREQSREVWLADRNEKQEQKIKEERMLKSEQLKEMEMWSRESHKERKIANTDIQRSLQQRSSENTEAATRRMASAKALQNEGQAYEEHYATLSKNQLESVREAAKESAREHETNQNTMQRTNEAKVAEASGQIEQLKAQQEASFASKKRMADAKRDQAYDELLLQKSNVGGAKSPESYRTELSENYPQGVTEESSTLGNKVIITRIVVKGEKADAYKKVLDKAGNYYFKNGQSISEITWNRETIDAFKKQSAD